MTIAKKITHGTVAKAGARGLCSGANVRTPCGPRRIEFVRKGDLIVTRDNGLQPVRMIWTQTVTQAEMAAVMVALDRQERGQGTLSAIQEVEQSLKVPVHSIVGLTDIIHYLEKQADKGEALAAMQDYRQQYGVT